MASLPEITGVSPTEMKRGPESMFFDARIPYELAAQMGDPQAILAGYGFQGRAAFDLVASELFQKELRKQVEAFAANGLTFRRRAEIIADDALPHVYELIKDSTAPSATRLDAIKWVTRMAGLEPNEKAATNNAFVLNIQMK